MRTRLSFVAAILLLLGLTAAAAAQEPRLLSAKGSYDDVRFELNNAIIARGLVVDHNGKLADMLSRTGPDIGSAKPIYKAAEFFSFCSAKLSRATMEADPANIGFCPYVVFIYESAAKPGEIVVGYRPTARRGDAASQAALAEVDKLLEGIVREAVK